MADADFVALLRAQDIEAFNARATALDDEEVMIDLRGADLQGLDLSEARLWRCDLTDANLTGCRVRALVLAGARLSGVILDEVVYVDDPQPVHQVLALWESAEDPDVWSDYRDEHDPLPMSGCDFRGLAFGAVDLSEMSMTSGHFADADLRACQDLDQLTLIGARMQSANLAGVEAFSLKLQRAVLDGASFEGAKLDCADLSQAKAVGTSFVNATLSDTLAKSLTADEANFDGATLEGVLFSDASLKGATFRGATLKGCIFGKATLAGCLFEDAKIEGCNFAAADVAGARFIRCQGLDLNGATNTDLAEVG